MSFDEEYGSVLVSSAGIIIVNNGLGIASNLLLNLFG